MTATTNKARNLINDFLVVLYDLEIKKERTWQIGDIAYYMQRDPIARFRLKFQLSRQ